MKTASIANAKDNLSRLIHQVESSEPIHLTRYGKPAAVLISEAQYKDLVSSDGGLFKAIQTWHKNIRPDEDELLIDEEIKQWRDRSPGRSFSWDE